MAYALFNINDGVPIIRKASAQGLGHLIAPYAPEDGPSCFPDPLPKVLSGRERLKRWHYDVWCAILRAALAGDGTDFRQEVSKRPFVADEAFPVEHAFLEVRLALPHALAQRLQLANALS